MKEQGVASVTVHYEKKELIVSFDDAKTNTGCDHEIDCSSWLPFPDRKMSSTDSCILTELLFAPLVRET